MSGVGGEEERLLTVLYYDLDSKRHRKCKGKHDDESDSSQYISGSNHLSPFLLWFSGTVKGLSELSLAYIGTGSAEFLIDKTSSHICQEEVTPS